MYVVLCLAVICLRSCVGFGVGPSSMMMRVPLQAGNWKCNPLSVNDAVILANEVIYIFFCFYMMDLWVRMKSCESY